MKYLFTFSSKLTRSFGASGSVCLLLGAAALALAGCSSDDIGNDANLPENEDYPVLTTEESLVHGAPSKADLPEEGKADAVYPEQFFELLAQQTPIRNQQRRGTCSIFATLAAVENLYVIEGHSTDIDFSEQYLQWSAKTELSAFPNTEGSSSKSNLEAISRYGIVEEIYWPYEARSWTEADDPQCIRGEEDLPTKCYTNGDPPEQARAAQRWYVPSGRWINSNTRSIKAHLFNKRQGVLVGGTFYYQAWNHGASKIPINSDYFRAGYVTNPNQADIDQANGAGHAIYIVGWDDNLQVPKRDGDGRVMTDSDGNTLYDKGFFIFKNSWGTDRFGINNPHGAGYGYLAYEYAARLTAYVSDVPSTVTGKEVCDDGRDNDKDSLADCDDPDCASTAACGDTKFYQSNQIQRLDDARGIESVVNVEDEGEIAEGSVFVEIKHPNAGEVSINLISPEGREFVVRQADGARAFNIRALLPVADLAGVQMKGQWKLRVFDEMAPYDGSLVRWTLKLTPACLGEACRPGEPVIYTNNRDNKIRDNYTPGANSNITVTDTGRIKAMKVSVEIDHPNQSDLILTLFKVKNPKKVVLQDKSGTGTFGMKEFDVADFVGDESEGTWRLNVADVSGGDVGTLKGWSLSISR